MASAEVQWLLHSGERIVTHGSLVFYVYATSNSCHSLLMAIRSKSKIEKKNQFIVHIYKYILKPNGVHVSLSDFSMQEIHLFLMYRSFLSD